MEINESRIVNSEGQVVPIEEVLGNLNKEEKVALFCKYKVLDEEGKPNVNKIELMTDKYDYTIEYGYELDSKCKTMLKFLSNLVMDIEDYLMLCASCREVIGIHDLFKAHVNSEYDEEGNLVTINLDDVFGIDSGEEHEDIESILILKDLYTLEEKNSVYSFMRNNIDCIVEELNHVVENYVDLYEEFLESVNLLMSKYNLGEYLVSELITDGTIIDADSEGTKALIEELTTVVGDVVRTDFIKDLDKYNNCCRHYKYMDFNISRFEHLCRIQFKDLYEKHRL